VGRHDLLLTWLDGQFARLDQAAEDGSEAGGIPEKKVWMVHSGGFYLVQKQKVPKVMPEKLHWFRWEAAWTWITGILLYILLYYHGSQLVSQGEDAPISKAAAIWLSVGLLIASVPVYELVWKLAKNQAIGVVASFGLITALNWWLARLFAPRGAYLQLGAMFGTIMAANVWMRILPAQRRMVAALKAGQTPNQAEALRAKTCSKHNTFIVVPVVFIMLSNHFPTIAYGQYSWMVLSALVLAGWGAAKWLRKA
jgi:uncharacterized membrane protein